MYRALLTLHVLAAVITVGPTAMAASRFPAALGRNEHSTAADLHRATRAYGTSSLLVPALGIALLTRLSWSPSLAWIAVSATLTAAQVVVLLAGILPAQQRALEPGGSAALARCRITAGIYNLAWASTIVVMVAKPWFTT